MIFFREVFEETVIEGEAQAKSVLSKSYTKDVNVS
jgi:hypothetical protein